MFKKKNSTEPEKKNSTEPEKKNSTEPEKKNSTEPEKENSTEPEKENSTEPEKENSTDEESLEEAIAEIAEKLPDTGEGDELDHAELTSLLEEARGKVAEHWNQCLRLQADIENLHKRSERDLANAHKYGLERFAAELLPVKDSLEMGLAAFDADNAEIDKLKEGVELTLQMLGNALERFEIKEVNPLDEPFNPDYHQAMSMQPRDDVEPNTVVTVVQKGYLLHDRLVRPAMVIVSQAPAAEE